MRTRRTLAPLYRGIEIAIAALAVAGGTLEANAASLAFELKATSAETYAKPHDIVLSPHGNRLYVADNDNDRIVRYRVTEGN